MENIIVAFVGQKISKVCWSHPGNTSSSPTDFITGSDDCRNTLITRWQIPSIEDGDFIEPYDVAFYKANGEAGKVKDWRVTSMTYT